MYLCVGEFMSIRMDGSSRACCGCVTLNALDVAAV